LSGPRFARPLRPGNESDEETNVRPQNDRDDGFRLSERFPSSVERLSSASVEEVVGKSRGWVGRGNDEETASLLLAFPFFCLSLKSKRTEIMKWPTPGRIIRFYAEGFRSMTVGRTLWAIILVKLFIMFAVLKLFFFPDFLAGKSDEEKAAYVLKELTEQGD